MRFRPRGGRVVTVLSEPEGAALFEQLDGEYRTAAELMSGTGLHPNAPTPIAGLVQLRV